MCVKMGHSDVFLFYKTLQLSVSLEHQSFFYNIASIEFNVLIAVYLSGPHKQGTQVCMVFQDHPRIQLHITIFPHSVPLLYGFAYKKTIWEFSSNMTSESLYVCCSLDK